MHGTESVLDYHCNLKYHDMNRNIPPRVINKFEAFSALHFIERPFIVGNVWDVTSAKLMEECGIPAIATSSAAVARSYGYDDGQQLPFSDLLDIVKRIRKHTSIPFSVDIERGYHGTIAGILENISRLLDLGIAGINIEDGTGDQRLRSASTFQKMISAISNDVSRKNAQLFINARTDAYLLRLPDALSEATTRAKAYEAAGANGFFVPFLTKIDDMKTIVKASGLPVNVFFCKDLPPFEMLREAGIRRISMGTALFRRLNDDFKQHIRQIQDSGCATTLLETDREIIRSESK